MQKSHYPYKMQAALYDHYYNSQERLPTMKMKVDLVSNRNTPYRNK